MFFTTLYRFFFSFSLIFYNNRSSHNIHSSGREITCINMYNNNNNNNNNNNPPFASWQLIYRIFYPKEYACSLSKIVNFRKDDTVDV